MKHLIWIVAYVCCLMGCNKEQQVVENHIILRGKEYSLWYLNMTDDRNPRFLYLDKYGIMKTLIYDIKYTKTFIPDRKHLLNGPWKNPSDSVLVFNGHSYRIISHEPNSLYSKSSLITLSNLANGDSIRLVDACFPPDLSTHYAYDEQKNKVHYKHWKDNIQSSILLKGEKYKLYRFVELGWGPDHFVYHLYFDDFGLTTCLDLIDYTKEGGFWLFVSPCMQNLPRATNWYQQEDTIFRDHQKYIILSATKDIIGIYGPARLQQNLLIDTKLPPSRK